MSGFEHLFYLTALLNWNADRIPDLQFNSTIMCETMIRPITTGNWQVQNTGIDIDFANQLVYFQGMRDSPLETHLYRVNYQKGNAHDESCLRLTKSNFNHFDISVFIDENMFLVKSSNVNTPTSIEIYRIPKPETAIFWTEEGVCPRPLAFLADDVTQTQQPKPEKLAKRESRGPEIFSFKNSSGDEIFGQIYKPENFDSKNKYPTIVYVYGGPRVQNIRNQFSASRSDRHRMYSKFGYVILTFDNRGSDNRGLKFEGVIKDHMGYYEVQDQVEGIAYVAQNMGFIDVNRVAIEGWSYGGFMSLMAIAQYPDVFKIAISVVDWRLYDSAYTERYLGLPQDNPKAYSDSSVVQQVPNLPDEPNRLLLFHGMIDENVITTNMMVLIEKLTRACKPYDLKLFVQERHSMRSSKTVEYYEMTVLTYLNQFL
ncbi:Oidioi.mRNA.OKI2018_I69.chr2.g6945.t1.cds [Oikopleura dioica]|nr:Oidioi.mRNA.OKI2018_I69.chr2.g6945.t1.cds [Oikopleura dioica]